MQSKGLSFKVVSSNYNEEQFSSDPIKTAVQFALGKASDVFQSLQNKDGVIVLGADTVVFHEGRILGKAPNDIVAKMMLKSLSGKTHSVITGYALISSEKTITGFSKSSVKFNNLSESTISEYIASGLYKGKAGSYGIQDGFPLVESFTGDYNNIVGLPVDEIILKLKEMV